MATVKARAQLDATWRGGSATRAAARDVGSLERESKKTGTAFGGLSKAAGLAVGAMAGLAVGAAALGKGLVTVTTLAAEQQRVEAQLAATLQSTGNAAGITAEEIKKMASELQTMTTFGDEAVIASSSLLLTFTKIGGDTFPRAQKAILDVATAMDMDLQSATVQVGKALNDPILGITALSRAGIQFSADQKETIKTMVEMGDAAGAQAIILKELETQFGGSAAAAADTFGGRMTQLQNVIGDVGEEIGFTLLPALTTIAEEAAPAILAAVEELRPEIEGFGESMTEAADAMVPVIQNMSTIIRVTRSINRLWRGVATLGISEVVRFYREHNDEVERGVHGLPPYVRHLETASARQTEFAAGSRAGRQALQSQNEEVDAAVALIPRYGESMDNMGEAHEQFEAAANASTAAIERQNSFLSDVFLETLNSAELETLDVEQALLKQAAAAGADQTALTMLAVATGDYTEQQIGAALEMAALTAFINEQAAAIAAGNITWREALANVRAFRDELNQIPNSKSVTISLSVVGGGNLAGGGTGTGPAIQRASGGSAGMNQPVLVGEQGPELFVPQTSGMIVNSSGTSQMMAGGNTINVMLANPVNAPPRTVAAMVATEVGRRLRG